jgi:hypothetical protein
MIPLVASKHERTRRALFEDPVRANIRYEDVERMFAWLGAEIVERSGSRVAVVLNGRTLIYHRPHPEKELGRPSIRDLRDFLTTVGEAP